jgi:hypothetical protein
MGLQGIRQLIFSTLFNQHITYLNSLPNPLKTPTDMAKFIAANHILAQFLIISQVNNMYFPKREKLLSEAIDCMGSTYSHLFKETVRLITTKMGG